MTQTKTIEAVLGQPITITLPSMVGSTGYGWNLTQLDGGLALYSASVVPVSPGIAPVHHIFEFHSVAVGTFKVVFDLLAPWRPGEAGDTMIFEVTIAPAKPTAAEDIESAMRGRDFVNAAAVQVGQPEYTSTVLKYATPMPTVLKYAAPMAAPVLKYAVPMAAPIVKYAAPASCIPDTDPCLAANQDPCLGGQGFQPPTVILYAAPITSQQRWYPQPLYAAPMTQVVRPLYAAPLQGFNSMVAYAAPYTGSGGCCC